MKNRWKRTVTSVFMMGKTKKPLSIHLGFVIAESICISAFILEISRALSGNTLSWAYVFEWPILGAYGVYMWRKLLSDDETRPLGAPSPVDDQTLAAYNEYLSQVHHSHHDDDHAT
jgi:hypothetical protein